MKCVYCDHGKCVLIPCITNYHSVLNSGEIAQVNSFLNVYNISFISILICYTPAHTLFSTHRIEIIWDCYMSDIFNKYDIK